MARLREYRARRDFRTTTEPPPGRVRKGASGARFVVHEHHARALHWDLRLEAGGVLLSFAVPKGPSLDPKERRLAVHTEDHPIEYLDFKGTIPAGEYGAGEMLIWDRGTWETEPPGEAGPMLKKGHLVFTLAGRKLHGRFHLVRTKAVRSGKEQWLLFKGKDDYVVARPTATAKDPISLLLSVWPPMSATLADPEEVTLGPGWVLESKYDGFRAVAGLVRGQVSLQSRNGLDLSERFPEVFRALQALPVEEAVLDGEICALDKAGRPRFQELQRGSGALRYFVFDLLREGGEDLRAQSLDERRRRLDSLLREAKPPLEVARRVSLPLEEALREARLQGLEGVIAKRRASTYQGERSREWLKLKVRASQELAIVGFTPIKTGAQAIGALLLAVREDGHYRYVGKVGTGFTDPVRRGLYATLSREKAEGRPAEGLPRLRGATYVTPRHVAQVEFSEWTGDGKVRAPSFQGLRDDKRPEECVRELPADER